MITPLLSFKSHGLLRMGVRVLPSAAVVVWVGFPFLPATWRVLKRLAAGKLHSGADEIKHVSEVQALHGGQPKNWAIQSRLLKTFKVATAQAMSAAKIFFRVAECLWRPICCPTPLKPVKVFGKSK